MAEGARLESVFRGNSNVGSNPTLSAIQFFKTARDIWSLARHYTETLTTPSAFVMPAVDGSSWDSGLGCIHPPPSFGALFRKQESSISSRATGCHGYPT